MTLLAAYVPYATLTVKHTWFNTGIIIKSDIAYNFYIEFCSISTHATKREALECKKGTNHNKVCCSFEIIDRKKKQKGVCGERRETVGAAGCN